MQAPSAWFQHTIKLWFVATLAIVVATGRGEWRGAPLLEGFGWMVALFGLAFAAYFLVLREPDHPRVFRTAIGAAILVRFGMLVCFPNLSDDVFRYVWDGRLWLEGLNPLDLLPSEWMATLPPGQAPNWQPLYDHLNSQHYHSVYPPVLQGVFAAVVSISRGEVYLSVVLMKAVILLAEIGSWWMLAKILRRLGLPRKAVLVYALNPMVAVELVGNCHFEALMVFFFLAACWMLMKWGIVPAAPMLALAVGSKLLPVLVFPFLVRRLGWGKTLLLGLLTAACCLPLLGWMCHGERAAHFVQSLQLYFQKFEFNGGLYYLVRAPLGAQGYWANRVLPWLVLALIVMAAVKERNRVWSGLPAAMMLALAFYHLLSPVVHPWYIAPLVALAALGPYRYPVVWSCFLPFTYGAYFAPEGVRESVPLMVMEYGTLLGFMAYEWSFRGQRLTLTTWILRHQVLRRLAQRTIPPRLRIKQARIASHLSKEEKILDIGTGNGGLCRALRQEGFDITPVDVQDQSFFHDVQPILYDGATLPFPDRSFDTSLLITVLHHTAHPEEVLAEATRVTRKRLVIMEDVYSNPFQKHLTFFTDSLVNLEFEGHPHTNRRDAQWQALFQERGLRLVYRETFRTLVFFRQVVYVVECDPHGH